MVRAPARSLRLRAGQAGLQFADLPGAHVGLVQPELEGGLDGRQLDARRSVIEREAQGVGVQAGLVGDGERCQAVSD